MNQLYYNLINNSISIPEPECIPDLNISSQTLSPAPTGWFPVQDKSPLYFGRQYASKIFTWFKRLHYSRTFSGTVIELASYTIVVGKQQWKISAVSQESQPASFTAILSFKQKTVASNQNEQ